MPTVSFFHGALVLGSATPPHRSTTFSPPTVSADRRADLAAFAEVALEGLGDALEAARGCAVDLHRPAIAASAASAA